jgi:hypothetical protein
VGLIDHDHRVPRKKRIHESLPYKETVGKKLDASSLRGDILKTYRIADLLANLAAVFFGDSDRYSGGSDTAGLRIPSRELAF